MDEEPLGLDHLLLTAEAVLGVRAEDLKGMVRIPEAESALAAPWAGVFDTLFYEDPVDRAGVLCSRLVRNHPLPDGNKRVAFLLMLEAIQRAGLTFLWLDATQDDVAELIERLASSELSEPAFLAWLREHVA